MALSRRRIKEVDKTNVVQPAFRQASEFDFFRGQSGSALGSSVSDRVVIFKLAPFLCIAQFQTPLRTQGTQTRHLDGTFCEQPFKRVKAFTDVGNIESMSNERWGAAKRVRGQSRLYCVNEFGSIAEPANDLPILAQREGAPSYIKHQEFLGMLESARFKQDISEASVMAVLKRTHIFVNSKPFLYIRPASENERPVLRIPLGDKTDLLHEDSRAIYDFHRKGGTDVPEDFARRVE